MEWVGMAVDFYKAAGRKVALAEFTNPEGRYVDGEMYIYALDSKGTMVAHGANERFVGRIGLTSRTTQEDPLSERSSKPQQTKETVG